MLRYVQVCSVSVNVAGPGAISSHPLPPRVSTSDESSAENVTTLKKPAFKPNPKSTRGSRKKKSEHEDETDADHVPLGGKRDEDSDESGDGGELDGDGIPLDLAGTNPKKRPAARAINKKPAGKSRKKEEAGYTL